MAPTGGIIPGTITMKNETIEEIQKYLDCIFKDDYIGIQEKYADVFELKRARLIKLS